MNNIAIIIPARLASTRLPNKPLAIINNKTMIERVCSQAKKSNISNIFVACDCQEIFTKVASSGFKAILTDPKLPSGTDRIYQAYQKISNKYEYIINLQGDLPNIDPQIINNVANVAIKNNHDITTLAYPITNHNEINDPNIVKIAIAFKKSQEEGRALYFSRSPIPYSKSQNTYYHHIGIYVYKAKSLEKFIKLAPSQLEKRESLEQLRALENNMSIYVKITNSRPISVDTQSDLEMIQKLISNEES